MAKTFDAIDQTLAAFLEAQPIFFVATGPLAADGLLNLSPKGLDSFRVLDPRTVAYVDLTGSGVETIAHLRENGRIVVCFCAFTGAPRIVRLHGRGEVVEPDDADFPALAARFPTYAGTRAVIRIHLTRIGDSCGYSVPRMRLEGERDQLTLWADHKGPQGLDDYRAEKNRTSLDGLPGLRPPRAR